MPYSEANLKMSFKPGLFFYDLENIAKQKRKKHSYAKIRSAYYRAVKNGYITLESGQPQLTASGKSKLKPYSPQELEGASLMIVFDIPEYERQKRRRLRILLKALQFKQVQKSVWITKFDCQELLKLEIEEQGLSKYVLAFEAIKLKI